MSPLKLYLCGPMTGIPQGNFPAFTADAKRLRDMGHEVVSPVELNVADGLRMAADPGHPRREEFLARDVRIVADPTVEGLVMLPGWEKSSGAQLEATVARALKKPLYELRRDARWEEWDLVPVGPEQSASERTILEEAGWLVDGPRATEYGHPADDLERTAGAWRALFGWDVDARRVALAMICVKLSRLVQSPEHRDSVIDVAGYARTYEAVLARSGTTDFLDLGPR